MPEQDRRLLAGAFDQLAMVLERLGEDETSEIEAEIAERVRDFESDDGQVLMPAVSLDALAAGAEPASRR